jgi:hypothetical protein
MGDLGGEDGEVYDMERSRMQGLAIGGIGDLRQIGMEQGQRVRLVEGQAQAEGEARTRVSMASSLCFFVSSSLWFSVLGSSLAPGSPQWT